MTSVKRTASGGRYLESDLVAFRDGIPGAPMSVFVSGSRSLHCISQDIRDSIDSIMDKRLHVLIGDSDKGADKEIIDYLKLSGYEHVTLFTILEHPRVAADPGWQVVTVDASSVPGAREKQMQKDRHMGSVANWGLAVFDSVQINRYGSIQVSSGTLRNSIQMLLMHKPMRFFYLYEGRTLVSTLRSIDDLERVLSSYSRENLTELECRMLASARGVPPGCDLSYAKCGKIFKKYKELLAAEVKRIAAPAGATSSSELTQLSLSLDSE